MVAIYNTWCRLVLVLLTVAVTPAGAVIITNYGVDTVSESYRIDATVSTVTYQPGLVLIINENGNPITEPQSQTYRIGGQFDADFLRYWWTYVVPGEGGTVSGPFTEEQHWLQFKNAHLEGLDTVTGFVFPDYLVSITGTELFGRDDDPCHFPFPPDTFCSGWSTGMGSVLEGQLEEGSLTLNGWSPLAGNLFEGFEYHIRASLLPVPGTVLLLIGGLGGLGLVLRARNTRSA